MAKKAKLKDKRESTPVPTRDAAPHPWLTIRGARHHNLKNIDVDIPLGRFVAVTGVSGSGKSSLVNDILREALAGRLNGAENVNPGAHDDILGLEHLDKIIDIDQSPIGRTPRSNPGTYIKVFDEIRSLYTQVPDSKVRGYSAGRFSFNVSTGDAGGGRCEACEGNGSNRLEMDFLADVWTTCPVCEGKRFNHETLQIRFRGKTIADVLDMDVQQALEHFDAIPKVKSMLQTLHNVGLDYLKIGQSSTTLSGGEAQRIKLARELVKQSTGRTLYVLDEPTTGLHFEDIRRLLSVLHSFVDAGNSVIVIEHNLDVIKTADWVIDLGPEGGGEGGRVVVAGTPEEVAKCEKSYTGQSLREVMTPRGELKASRKKTAGGRARESFSVPQTKYGKLAADSILVVGAKEHNLKDVTVRVPRGQMTVCTGVSGSGKSSFAIDTVYTEGQRRYVESLSSYARQFLGRMQKPKVDHVYGLSPAIAIEQKAAANTPRSTVGTVTEIYDYMRVLWARLGTPHCPKCNVAMGAQSSEEVVDKILALGEDARLMLCAPIEPGPGETWETLIGRMQAQGYVRVRVDGEVLDLPLKKKIDARRKHAVEMVIDRIIVRAKSRQRIADSVEHALSLGKGVIVVVVLDESSQPQRALRFSQHLSCEVCGTSYEEITPHHLSFNSRLGWCEQCEGLGIQRGTSQDAIITRPAASILNGAVAGWTDVENRPLLRAMLVSLARAIGFDAKTPCRDLTPDQRHALLFGLGDRWVSVEADGAAKNMQGLRIQWKGFYPAIDEATKVSWQYRYKLQELVTEVPCQSCGGGRVKPQAASVRMGGKSIVDACAMSLSETADFFKDLRLDRRQAKIAGELLHEIKSRLRFLLDVGLGYLTLGRSAPTLSGGESQRIRLASQIGSGLTGVLYVLDEPTIGLHPRDNRRLVDALHKLRDLGNTLLMVEHDAEVLGSSDHLIDFGPGAGVGGGHVMGEGSPTALKRQPKSLTGQYLSGKAAIPVPTNRRPIKGFHRDGDKTISVKHEDAIQPALTVVGARQNNLKQMDVQFPLGRFICVTGVSGSGKSSLITEILAPVLASRLHGASGTPGAHDEVRGLAYLDKIINVDQQPIGNSPLSSPATYTGVFDLIREVFAKLPDSKVRGFTENKFSFNRPGGRCDDCEGLGQVCHEMHFLPDVWVPCESCGGSRYRKETLEVQFKGKSIADVLQMPVSEALEHFSNVPKVRRLLQTLEDVGLGYLSLGQSAPTLSGGESQRVKLATQLGRPSTGKTIYVLDEPTTGLHFDDLRKLLDVLHRFVDLGNTVLCIEHNLDVIKTADWIIDLGPEAGDAGGRIVAEGTPEQVTEVAASHTGRLLKKVLMAGPHKPRVVYDPKQAAKEAIASQEKLSIAEVDGASKMPWQRDGRRWHTQERTSRDGKAVDWEGAALGYIVDLIEKAGKSRLLPTDWNDRARVEIIAAAPEGVPKAAVPWLMHALTGGRWMVDLLFRVPSGAFSQRKLAASLNLKTLDERDDIPAYSSTSRVIVRPRQQDMDQVRIQVHDKKEISTPGFKSFIESVVKAYLQYIDGLAHEKADVEPWKKDGKAWHLSQQSIPATQPKQWKPMDLAAFIGMTNKALPAAKLDWSGKVFVEVVTEMGQRIAKIITHQGESIRVDVNVPPGRLTPIQVEGLGIRRELNRAGSSGAGLTFWFQSMSQIDAGALKRTLVAAVESIVDRVLND